MSSATRRSDLPWLFAAVLAALLCCRNACAHKVNIFATVEGNVIKGESFLSGGGRPKGCLVEFFGADGKKLGEARTNDKGEFAFKPRVRTDHRIMLDMGDGHRAEFTIKADELPATLAHADDVHTSPAEGAGERGGATMPDIEERVSKAVAKELRPLRRQIDHLENQLRLRDVLGGIGYIFGLAGVVLYLKCRQRRSA